MKKRIILILIYLLSQFWNFSVSNAEDWMLDTNLRRVVSERLGVENLTTADMKRLRGLVSQNDGIVNIKGLEHAVNLTFLHIGRSGVSETPLDLTPLAELVNLHTLKLIGYQISDISLLSGLIGLRELHLQGNLISDLTPLANLHSLRVIRLNNNQISDISPLSGLIGLREIILVDNAISDFTPLISLTNLETLQIYPNPIPFGNQFIGIDASHLKASLEYFICEIPRPTYTAPVTERIKNRDYPSVFLTHKRRNLYHDPDPFHQLIQYDFSFSFEPLGPLAHSWTFNSPFGGMVRTGNAGDMAYLSQIHEETIRENPNMVSIVSIAYFNGGDEFRLPEDSPYWFRNPDGLIAQRLWKVDDEGNEYYEPLLNFTHPDVIEMIIQQAVAIAKCGVYDGIWLDRWEEDGDFHGELRHLVSRESELNARIQILQGIRASVPEDFLIMVNSTEELPHSAPYVNGVFIEAGASKPIYTYKDLYSFENIIKWYESNLRKPSFTLLWGGVDHKTPTSQLTVRQFTTLSLTHSDGYVNVSSGHPDITTLWYDFWDADLGRPIGEKGQLYEKIDGLFIREFTNGWAVYNRSGVAQTISLSEQITGVSSQITDRVHTIPDLDGEMYLRVAVIVDVNGDGVVNILDLVIVANSFGEATPDLNSDGIVNILDLVIVANAFE